MDDYKLRVVVSALAKQKGRAEGRRNGQAKRRFTTKHHYKEVKRFLSWKQCKQIYENSRRTVHSGSEEVETMETRDANAFLRLLLLLCRKSNYGHSTHNCMMRNLCAQEERVCLTSNKNYSTIAIFRISAALWKTGSSWSDTKSSSIHLLCDCNCFRN